MEERHRFFDFLVSAAIWAEDMGDKAERRRKREASVRALNGVAEAVGLEAINIRANNEESQPVFLSPSPDLGCLARRPKLLLALGAHKLRERG